MLKNQEKPSRALVLETFAVLALFSLIIQQVLGHRLLAWLAILLLSIALFAKQLALLIAGWWLRMAAKIASFNNRILLGAVFYLVLVPVAAVYKLFNKDPLELKWQQKESYYSERNHTFQKTDLEKMW
jgi:hypothetical protein